MKSKWLDIIPRMAKTVKLLQIIIITLLITIIILSITTLQVYNQSLNREPDVIFVTAEGIPYISKNTVEKRMFNPREMEQISQRFAIKLLTWNNGTLKESANNAYALCSPKAQSEMSLWYKGNDFDNKLKYKIISSVIDIKEINIINDSKPPYILEVKYIQTYTEGSANVDLKKIMRIELIPAARTLTSIFGYQIDDFSIKDNIE